ncbi:unnamed protein product, partial [Didymodactylos carnosus]
SNGLSLMISLNNLADLSTSAIEYPFFSFMVGIKKPASDHEIISFTLPTFVATKGVLDAIDSNNTNGEHSILDGNKKRSASIYAAM